MRIAVFYLLLLTRKKWWRMTGFRANLLQLIVTVHEFNLAIKKGKVK